MIEEYHFGSITINGKTYNSDVIVNWKEEVFSWQREESHIIDAKDVKSAIDQNPEVIVVGTGEAGIAQLTDTARQAICEKGIKLVVEKTGEAKEIFNKYLKEGKKVIGLFHLTC